MRLREKLDKGKKHGTARLAILFAIIAIAASFSSGVPLMKDSAPFTFKDLNSVKKSSPGPDPIFACQTITGRAARLSWSIAGPDAAGEIAIYSLSGTRLKSFDISKKAGTVIWEIGREGVSHGIYLAKIKSGSYRNDFKLAIINRGN